VATDDNVSPPQARFVRPPVGELLRHAAPHVAEASLIPVAVFYATLNTLGLHAALVCTLGWSYAMVARRLIGSERVPGILVLSAAALTVRTAVALATSSAYIYFLQPTFTTAALGCAFAASLICTQPLAQRLAVDFVALPSELLAQPRLRRCFVHITVVWALAQFANAGVTVWLLSTQSLDTFLLARTVVGLAVSALAVAVSAALFFEAVRRPAVRPANAVPLALAR